MDISTSRDEREERRNNYGTARERQLQLDATRREQARQKRLEKKAEFDSNPEVQQEIHSLNMSDPNTRQAVQQIQSAVQNIDANMQLIYNNVAQIMPYTSSKILDEDDIVALMMSLKIKGETGGRKSRRRKSRKSKKSMRTRY
jgi:hypothetical protein